MPGVRGGLLLSFSELCGTELLAIEGDGHGVEREGTQQVAAHAGFGLNEGAGGVVDPLDAYALREAGKFGFDVQVADKAWRSGDDEEQVFNEAAEGAEEAEGFLRSVGAGAVLLGGLEKGREIWLPKRGAEQEDGVLTAGEVGRQVEGEGAADGAFREAGGESAVLRFQLGTAKGEEGFEVRGGEGAEAMHDGAGADGGEQLLGVFGEEDERGVLRRLFKDFEQAVGGLFHEGRGGEDGEGAAGLDRGAVEGDVDDLADLAKLDEELRRIGRDDEQVGVGLNEDAGFFLVGLAEGFTGLDGFGDEGFEVGGVGDAAAVGTLAAEVGKVVGFSWIGAVDGLGEHEGEGVFAGAFGAGEDERMGKALGADGFAEMGDGLGVA